MSEQRSTQHGATRRATMAPFQRIYLATLRRRLFARRLFSPAGPGCRRHAPRPGAAPPLSLRTLLARARRPM
jgi:hypothetical protein